MLYEVITLDVVEPYVRIESLLCSRFSHLRYVSGTGVVAREGEESMVVIVEIGVGA